MRSVTSTAVTYVCPQAVPHRGDVAFVPFPLHIPLCRCLEREGTDYLLKVISNSGRPVVALLDMHWDHKLRHSVTSL